ncbi:hypothetical protein [Nonomuraea sp. SYSU D8015]|uniref:hypothetical protein n=1 Tax=Nonomuraea sp. SYSU D8015 TaxID=2593644 RepID=UPI001660BDCB|nr:hypothetical protein [Nonomuraea sp. SYSU D8015]
MHALDVLGGAVATPAPYGVDSVPLGEDGMRLERLRRFWSGRLNALAAELARARRERRHPLGETPSTDGRPDPDHEEEEDE